MNGLLVDFGLRGQRAVLLGLFLQPSRREIWSYLGGNMPSFEDIPLAGEVSDLLVWQTCQDRRWVLLTDNRNEKGAEPLEWVIRTHNRPESLPVITLANSQRIMRNTGYGHRVADKLLELLFDIEKYFGAGRLWVP